MLYSEQEKNNCLFVPIKHVGDPAVLEKSVSFMQQVPQQKTAESCFYDGVRQIAYPSLGTKFLGRFCLGLTQATQNLAILIPFNFGMCLPIFITASVIRYYTALEEEREERKTLAIKTGLKFIFVYLSWSITMFFLLQVGWLASPLFPVALLISGVTTFFGFALAHIFIEVLPECLFVAEDCQSQSSLQKSWQLFKSKSASLQYYFLPTVAEGIVWTLMETSMVGIAMRLGFSFFGCGLDAIVTSLAVSFIVVLVLWLQKKVAEYNKKTSQENNSGLSRFYSPLSPFSVKTAFSTEPNSPEFTTEKSVADNKPLKIAAYHSEAASYVFNGEAPCISSGLPSLPSFPDASLHEEEEEEVVVLHKPVARSASVPLPLLQKSTKSRFFYAPLSYKSADTVSSSPVSSFYKPVSSVEDSSAISSFQSKPTSPCRIPSRDAQHSDSEVMLFPKSTVNKEKKAIPCLDLDYINTVEDNIFSNPKRAHTSPN